MNLHILVLTTLRDRGGRMNFTDLLNHLPIHEEGGRVYPVLRELNQLGWITGDLRSGSIIRLTPAGQMVLLEQYLKQSEPTRNAEPKQNISPKLTKPGKFFDFLKRIGVELVVALVLFFAEILFSIIF